MKFVKESWIKAVKKAVSDTKLPASSGMVCAIATLRVVRDGMCDDIGDKNDEAKADCETVKMSINELIQQIAKAEGDAKTLCGFAGNASAAAKAAGFEGGKAVLMDLQA